MTRTAARHHDLGGRRRARAGRRGVTLLATSGGDDNQSVVAPGESGTDHPRPRSPPRRDHHDDSRPRRRRRSPPPRSRRAPSWSTRRRPRPPPTTTPTTHRRRGDDQARHHDPAVDHDRARRRRLPTSASRPTEIRLAVISDSPDAIAGTKAWAEWVNKRSGIAGRKIRLDVFETQYRPVEVRGRGEDGLRAGLRDRRVARRRRRQDDRARALRHPRHAGAHDLRRPCAGGPTPSPSSPTRVTSRLVGGYKWLLDHVDRVLRPVRDRARDPDQQDAAMQLVEAANSVGFTLVDTLELTDDARAGRLRRPRSRRSMTAREPRVEPPRLRLDREPPQGGRRPQRHRRQGLALPRPVLHARVPRQRRARRQRGVRPDRGQPVRGVTSRSRRSSVQQVHEARRRRPRRPRGSSPSPRACCSSRPPARSSPIKAATG